MYGERVYLQYIPTVDSRAKLAAVQREARAAYGGEPIDPQHFHLTLLHVGIVGALYTAVRQASPQLEADTFGANIAYMMQAVETAMPRRVQVRLNGYKRFNPDHTTLVALAGVSPRVRTAQQFAVTALEDCLAASGVHDPTAFMRQDKNLQHATDYEPHISLLYGAGYAAEIPALQETIQLEAMPPRYDVAHGRTT